MKSLISIAAPVALLFFLSFNAAAQTLGQVSNAILAAASAASQQLQTTAMPSAKPKTPTCKVGGYLWYGNHYWGGQAYGVFDRRGPLQGQIGCAFSAGKRVQLVPKVWFSVSAEADAQGKRGTGFAQEGDVGGHIIVALPGDVTAQVGGWRFYVAEAGGGHIDTAGAKLSRPFKVGEGRTLTVSFEYNYYWTNKRYFTGGALYGPNLSYTRSWEKYQWSVGTGFARNTDQIFGLRSETATKVASQFLMKTPRGRLTGPDFTYGGTGSRQRPRVFTFGWGYYF
jgi:hypothetical protein